MSCTGCSTNKDEGGGCGKKSSCTSCGKLTVFDWLAHMEYPKNIPAPNIVEVRFKNGRKDFFTNQTGVELFQGDVVATEVSPGHDIGVVSMTGELVSLQMKKKNVKTPESELKKVYRKAKQNDIDKWHEARKLEEPTMFKARTLALKLKLQMKISDVEYQGDKTKAVFYYTADDRVDFRELIKVMADEFKVKIEMKQIGARQEASRLGGIGSCGRELCCSTWLTDFRSVATSAARYQQLSLNPLKLAGQCGKLKCCLNFELDSYMDALKDLPDTNTKLESTKGRAFHQKTDIFKRIMWFSYFDSPSNFIPLSVERVKEIIELNKDGKKPDDLITKTEAPEINLPDYENVVGQDSLTRFDNAKKKKKKKKKKNPEAATIQVDKPQPTRKEQPELPKKQVPPVQPKATQEGQKRRNNQENKEAQNKGNNKAQQHKNRRNKPQPPPNSLESN